MHSNSDMHSLQYPSIPSSHPKHHCAAILYNNQLYNQLALLLKEKVKKAKLYKCK